MGKSDKVHFAWLSEAIEAFESQTGRLSALASKSEPLVLYGLGQSEIDIPTRAILDKLPPARVEVMLFNKYFTSKPGVQYLDLNDMSSLPDNSCDLLTLFRASYFVQNPERFLSDLHRILRLGGLAFIDWCIGDTDTPRIGFGSKGPIYGGVENLFRTTYCDDEFLRGFSREYEALAAHVRQPPWWVGWQQEPGLSGRLRRQVRRLRQLLGFQSPGLLVGTHNFLEVLRTELASAGNFLVTSDDVLGRFEVLFRHARYQHPLTGKFFLYNLTVWSPLNA